MEEEKGTLKAKTTFRLGITLAGGVTAGAYSAGVIYYLLKNFKEWHDAKGKDPSVPDHDVMIDVIGGASAGSMVAALFAISLGYDDYGTIDYEKTLLFDSWVNVLDKCDRDTLAELLKNPRNPQTFFSLLNANAIGTLKEEQLAKIDRKPIKIPTYINADGELHVLFTLASLKGVPVGVRFSQSRMKNPNTTPAHYMNVHRYVAHYKINGETNERYLNPKLNSEPEDFINTAQASGAFPIGLPPQALSFSKSYMRNMINETFSEIENNLMMDSLDGPGDWEFHAVDGGTFNNEPFTEVEKIVKDKADKNPHAHHAILLIDPFPNFLSNTKTESPDLSSARNIAINILDALRGQSLLKDTRALEGFVETPNIGMIFPSRRDKDYKPLTPALASDAISGFAGFIDRSFRLHDFILGMKNCQSFIRWYFHISEEDTEKYISYKDWKAGDARYKRFHIMRRDNCSKTEVAYFPIIPDMSIPADETVNHKDSLIKGMEFPAVELARLYKYGSPLRRRIRYLILSQLFTPSKTPKVNLPVDDGILKVTRFYRFLNVIMKVVLVLFGLGILGSAYAFMHLWAFWGIVAACLLFGFLFIYWILPELLKNKIMKIVLKTLEEAGQIKSKA